VSNARPHESHEFTNLNLRLHYYFTEFILLVRPYITPFPHMSCCPFCLIFTHFRHLRFGSGITVANFVCAYTSNSDRRRPMSVLLLTPHLLNHHILNFCLFPRVEEQFTWLPSSGETNFMLVPACFTRIHVLRFVPKSGLSVFVHCFILLLLLHPGSQCFS